jgi:hypothetical protein
LLLAIKLQRWFSKILCPSGRDTLFLRFPDAHIRGEITMDNELLYAKIEALCRI